MFYLCFYAWLLCIVLFIQFVTQMRVTFVQYRLHLYDVHASPPTWRRCMHSVYPNYNDRRITEISQSVTLPCTRSVSLTNCSRCILRLRSLWLIYVCRCISLLPPTHCPTLPFSMRCQSVCLSVFALGTVHKGRLQKFGKFGEFLTLSLIHISEPTRPY